VTCPTLKLEDYPLSFVRDFLFNIFTTTLHIWMPFFHPQPEDAPCCGDRDPFIMGCVGHNVNNVNIKCAYILRCILCLREFI
jgi:hypothetical protein